MLLYVNQIAAKCVCLLFGVQVAYSGFIRAFLSVHSQLLLLEMNLVRTVRVTKTVKLRAVESVPTNKPKNANMLRAEGNCS